MIAVSEEIKFPSVRLTANETPIVSVFVMRANSSNCSIRASSLLIKSYMCTDRRDVADAFARVCELDLAKFWHICRPSERSSVSSGPICFAAVIIIIIMCRICGPRVPCAVYMYMECTRPSVHDLGKLRSKYTRPHTHELV